MVYCWIENIVAAKHQGLCLVSIAKAISRLSCKPFIDIADIASVLLNFSYQTRAVGNSGDEEFRLKIWFS